MLILLSLYLQSFQANKMDSLQTLVARKLRDDKEDKKVCPAEDTSGPAIVPIVGNFTFHDVASIVSGACAIASIIIAAVLIARHAMNYSNPVQQRQILRVILLIPWVAIFSFLIVWQEGAGEYMVESLDFGCAIALSSFLLLMCDFVLSHRGGFEELFGDGAWAKGTTETKGPAWLKWIWYGVLQLIPTSIIIWLVTVISLAVGTYCKQSNSIHFAHIWITILKVVVTVIAILNCLRFYGRFKKILKQHGVILKLFTFKGIIGINVFQTFLINILSGQDVLKPSKYLTYHDINGGLAPLLLACEMPFFALLIAVAFSTKPYKKAGSPAAGPVSAVIDAFNITDLLSMFVRGPMRLVMDQQRQILRQDSMRVGAPDDASLDHEVLIERAKRARYDSTV
jgi:hypothetical protein